MVTKRRLACHHYVSEDLPASVWVHRVCVRLVSSEPEEAVGPPEVDITDSCKLLCGW